MIGYSLLTPIFHGRTEGGRLILRDRQAFEHFLKGLSGKQIEVLVRIPDKERSLQQNRFFHAVVLPLLAEGSGCTVKEMKAVLKAEFNIAHTSQLSTKQFAEFIEGCCQLGAETLNVVIPDPRNVEF